MRNIAAALLIVGIALPAAGLDAPLSRFQAANEAYKNQDCQAALQGYEGLIAEGAKDPILYYNAGCALAQLGQKGRAIAMFARALKMEPRFAEAHENLARIAPTAQEKSAFFLFLPFVALFRAATAEGFFLAAIVGWWLFALAAAAWILLRPGAARTATAAVASLSLVAALFFGVYFLAKQSQEGRIEAVVVAEKVMSRSGPSDKYTELDMLSEGVKVRMLEPPREGWVKTQLPGGRIGYLPEDAVERI
ncbi:MAG: hypothetical protein NTW86_30385 [Candidatus Sumerlaeota bacterium]|nr:hypothetical protein [Candidatus Sumerlaeota bacterium]